jgi:hypothetical protein
MSTSFFALAEGDRRAVLEEAAVTLTQNPVLLEKDIWVVWALQTLFGSPAGDHLVFKGGTSLSKCFRIIERFSEDVDMTCDIRTIAPDLVDEEATLPATRNQAQKLTETIRERLPRWIATEIVPRLVATADEAHLGAEIVPEGDRVWIRYPTLMPTESTYVAAAVQLEFGARSTGAPSRPAPVSCDIAALASDLDFPAATPRAMLPTRTFWEKATAAHVFCLKGSFRGGERYARHWHDLSRLHTAGTAADAIQDRGLALDVAAHKSVFFIENDRAGNRIDYTAAVVGQLQLVPDGEAFAALEADYQEMLNTAMLPLGTESFAALMGQCAELEDEANRGPRTSDEQLSALVGEADPTLG